MRATKRRLLDPALIPVSLWDPKTTSLRIPPTLTRAYTVVIQRHGLDTLAESRDPNNPPVGGITQEKTDQHFAQAFDGSAARAQLALLDPNGEVGPASDACLASLTGNRLSLTDAPCGAGAAAFAFLAAIAELRASSVLPRQPLDVFLLGAELSEPVRAYAGEILSELRAAWEAQAIFLEAELLSWDVTDALCNTDLIKRMTQVSVTHPRLLLVVANFNAFLVKERKLKKAEPQLGELFRHASGDHSVAIWIEPNMNTVTDKGGLFSRLLSKMKSAWRLFARERSGGVNPVLTTSARFHLPLSPAETARVALAVSVIDLVRTK